jgi:hypothetical protein
MSYNCSKRGTKTALLKKSDTLFFKHLGYTSQSWFKSVSIAVALVVVTMPQASADALLVPLQTCQRLSASFV